MQIFCLVSYITMINYLNNIVIEIKYCWHEGILKLSAASSIALLMLLFITCHEIPSLSLSDQYLVNFHNDQVQDSLCT